MSEKIDIREFGDQVVICFGTEKRQINAYTLASTLVSIADAAKAANASINHGFNIEIVVEALGEGSFRAQLKAVYSEAKNLFSKESLRAVVLSVVAAVIYEHTFSPEQTVEVHIHDDSVVIEQGATTVVIPRDVYNAVQEVKKSEAFHTGIAKTFSAVEKDSEIQSIGVVPEMSSPPPERIVPRERFAAIASGVAEEREANSRTITEPAELTILRAILERNKRRWEFAWRGVRIPAPVLDGRFFDEFFAHSIRIAPGDTLEVVLKIYQKKDPDSGIYTNEKYEVVEVLKHTPRLDQSRMIEASEEDNSSSPNNNDAEGISEPVD
jgi:hypothetical protein